MVLYGILWYFQVLESGTFWYFMVLFRENYTLARKEMELSVIILNFYIDDLGFCGNIWDSCQYRIEIFWD